MWGVNSLFFELNVAGNTTDFDEILISMNYNNNTLDSGSLDKGASVSGNLIGQAKKNAKLKLEYQPSFLNDKTVKVSLNQLSSIQILMTLKMDLMVAFIAHMEIKKATIISVALNKWLIYVEPNALHSPLWMLENR